TERDFHRSGGRVQVRLLLEPLDQRAGPGQRLVKIIDAEEKEQSVSGRGPRGIRQGRMLVVLPPMKTQQNGAVLARDLAEVVMRRWPDGQAQQLLVPREAMSDILDPDNCPQ